MLGIGFGNLAASGGKIVIPTGTYLIGGAGMVANKGSAGGQFTASNPAFFGTYDIVDITYSAVSSKFVLVGNSSTVLLTFGEVTLITTDGSSYTTPTGANSFDTDANTKFFTFATGNIVLSKTGASNTGNDGYSTDGGATWLAVTGTTLNSYVPTGYVGAGNSAILYTNGGANSYYCTDGLAGGTVTQLSDPGFQNVKATVYLNGNYIAGQATSAMAFKTVISNTLTPFTGNLSSSTFLGGVWDGTAYVIFNAISLSTATTVSGTWTSQTTAFFTTAAMTGNIVAMATDGVGTIVAVTDAGCVGRSTDHGVTWTKLSAGANPLSGGVCKGVKYILSNFWIYGSLATNGAIAFSANGSSFSNLPVVGFTGNAILSIAGH